MSAVREHESNNEHAYKITSKTMSTQLQYHQFQIAHVHTAQSMAICLCMIGTDRTGFEARKIDDEIGMGVFATKALSEGDFFLHYR